MLPHGLRGVVWGRGKECVQHLLSENTPAVSTATGKKLTLLLPSTSRASEAGQKPPTKDQLYPAY